MPYSRKLHTAVIPLFAAVVLALSGCSSGNGKVNVIHGPGKANSSMLISFNELCGGSALGFLGTGGRLLVSVENGSKVQYDAVDTAKGTKNTVFTLPAMEAGDVSIAPDGSSFLSRNWLIPAAKGEALSLPNKFSKSGFSSSFAFSAPSYSFSEDSDLLLTDPRYYLQRYTVKTSAFLNPRILPVRDRVYSTENRLYNLQLPAITAVKKGTLITGTLKYIFIGETSKKSSPLYVLDLFTQKFTLLADNVTGYTLSPARTMAAYVETGNDGGNDRLVTVNLESGAKKALMQEQHLEAVQWSSNSSWIAWSGGTSSKMDIGIIKADGTSTEQLTNGMYPTGKPFWSGDGKKLAFTSHGREKKSNPRVYILTLNNTETGWDESASMNEQRRIASQKLLAVLRSETEKVLESEANME